MFSYLSTGSRCCVLIDNDHVMCDPLSVLLWRSRLPRWTRGTQRSCRTGRRAVQPRMLSWKTSGDSCLTTRYASAAIVTDAASFACTATVTLSPLLSLSTVRDGNHRATAAPWKLTSVQLPCPSRRPLPSTRTRRYCTALVVVARRLAASCVHLDTAC